MRTFDATGWPSHPGCLENPDACVDGQPVYKGSAEKPTTVIMCGSITAHLQSIGRANLVEASVKSIIEAVRNPKSRRVN